MEKKMKALAAYAAGILLLMGSVAYGVSPVVVQDPSNVNRNMKVNADGSINVSGTISATNPSVGTNGAATPTSSTATGYQDVSGNLIQDSTSNPHPITCISGCSTTGVAQGSTTSGQTVQPIGCRTLSSLPTDTTAKTNMPACTTSGELSTHDASLLAAAQAAIPAGTNSIGKVQIDQGTPGTTNAVQPIPGTTGGLSLFYLTAAASTNATNVKASAGQLYRADLSNNSATPAYVSFYNNSGTPTCGTSIVYQMMIPANSTSGAGWVSAGSMGLSFSSGIGICVTTGIAGTGNVAASAYTISLGYK